MVEVLNPSSIWGQLVSSTGGRWRRQGIHLLWAGAVPPPLQLPPLAAAAPKGLRPLISHARVSAGQPLLPPERSLWRPAAHPHLPLPGLLVSLQPVAWSERGCPCQAWQWAGVRSGGATCPPLPKTNAALAHLPCSLACPRWMLVLALVGYPSWPSVFNPDYVSIGAPL